VSAPLKPDSEQANPILFNGSTGYATRRHHAAADAGQCRIRIGRFSVGFGVEGGGSVELPMSSGTAEFRVAGFYCDDAGNQAVVMMDTATYQRLYSDAGLTRQNPVRGQSLGRAGYGG
jgi:hypothetical protein